MGTINQKAQLTSLIISPKASLGSQVFPFNLNYHVHTTAIIIYTTSFIYYDELFYGF